MSRMYIDAIALLKSRPTPPDGLDAKGIEGFRCCLHRYNAQIERMIANRDKDVVEVVRCKDCFYSEKILSDECPKKCSWCRKLCFVTHENHYCSFGERREE